MIADEVARYMYDILLVLLPYKLIVVVRGQFDLVRHIKGTKHDLRFA